MKELESILKIVSDGLKTLAKGVEAIAEKVDETAKSQKPAKPTPKKAPKPAKKPAKKSKTAKKTVRKTAGKKAGEGVTASDNVFGIIARSSKGVAMAEILEKTGYNQKKVANIIYRLKKQNKIKSVEKGVYAKV
jgi:hypothetical protein